MEIDLNKIWERLNKRGIYTMEQFEEAYKNVKIDIGMFVTPLNNKKEDK